MSGEVSVIAPGNPKGAKLSVPLKRIGVERRILKLEVELLAGIGPRVRVTKVYQQVQPIILYTARHMQDRGGIMIIIGGMHPHSQADVIHAMLFHDLQGITVYLLDRCLLQIRDWSQSASS